MTRAEEPGAPAEVSWLPVLVLFAGLGMGGLRNPWMWSVAAVVVWAAAARVPLRPADVPGGPYWLLWLAWTGLSAAASPEPMISLAAFARTATAGAFLFLAAGSLDQGGARRTAFALLGAGLVLGLASLLVPVPGRPMTGLLIPYYNYSAGLQAAVFAASLGAIFAGGGRREAPPPVPLIAAAAFSGALIFAAQSRGAAVAAAAAAAVLALRRRAYKTLVLGGALAALGAFTFLPMSTLTQMLKLHHQGAYVRPQIWRAAIRVANEGPLLGEGPGRFERGFRRHNFPAPAGHEPTRYGLRASHAHSDILHTAAETGWAGLLLYLLALAAAWRGAWRRAKGWAGEAALTAAAALFAHSVFENNFALPALHWLFFALLAAAWRSGSAPPTARPRAGTGQVFLCAGGLALAALAWWPSWAVREHRGRAIRAAGGESLVWLGRALEVEPENPELWGDLARAYMRLELPLPRHALSALDRAIERDPYGAHHMLMAAELLRLEGRWRPMELLARAALDLEPASRPARLALAEAAHHLGRNTEAGKLLAGIAGPPLPAEAEPGYETVVLYLDPERHARVRRLIHGGR